MVGLNIGANLKNALTLLHSTKQNLHILLKLILTKPQFTEISTAYLLSNSKIWTHHQHPCVPRLSTWTMHPSAAGFRYTPGFFLSPPIYFLNTSHVIWEPQKLKSEAKHRYSLDGMCEIENGGSPPEEATFQQLRFCHFLVTNYYSMMSKAISKHSYIFLPKHYPGRSSR